MTSKDKEFENYLNGRSPLTRVYRDQAHEVPPMHLDDAILNAARRAVRRPPGGARGPFGAHWFIPLSAAAVIVLTVGWVVFMGSEWLTPLTAPDERLHLAREAPATAPAAPPSREAPASGRVVPIPSTAAPGGAPEAKSAQPKLRELRPEPASAPGPVGAATSALTEKSQMNRRDKREQAMPANGADVISVAASGPPGAYQFAVGIRSPDRGCARYADWWEVVGLDGTLLYRRVLQHSHVDEQPFVRSGGPVPIPPDTVVWVRAHMRPEGYGGAAFKGSVRAGFQQAELSPAFAAGLARTPPLPEGCDF